MASSPQSPGRERTIAVGRCRDRGDRVPQSRASAGGAAARHRQPRSVMVASDRPTRGAVPPLPTRSAGSWRIRQTISGLPGGALCRGPRRRARRARPPGAPHHGPLAGSAGHALLGERAPVAGRRVGGRGSVAASPTGHRGGIRRLAAARRADSGAGGRLVPAGIPGLERRRLPAPRGDDHLDGARRLRRAARRGASSAGQRARRIACTSSPGCRVRPCCCTAASSWAAWWRPPTPSGSSRSCRADARSRFPGLGTACTATPATLFWRR